MKQILLIYVSEAPVKPRIYRFVTIVFSLSKSTEFPYFNIFHAVKNTSSNKYGYTNVELMHASCHKHLLIQIAGKKNRIRHSENSEHGGSEAGLPNSSGYLSPGSLLHEAMNGLLSKPNPATIIYPLPAGV